MTALIDKTGGDADGGGGAPRLQRENPAFTPQPWDNGAYTVQRWLERAPGHSLKDTEFGAPVDNQDAHPVVHEDPLVREIHRLDIATFLTAERTSMLGISELIKVAPDENSQVFLATQLIDETRHYEVFCRRLADFGVTPEERERLMERATVPALRKFYDLILEQADKGDYITAILAHNIILEGMAYPLYAYQRKYWSVFDPGLSEIVKRVFSDEIHHVGYGERWMSHVIHSDPVQMAKVKRLADEFYGLMFEIYEEILGHFIGLYQAASDAHMDLVGGIEIFPGRKMQDISEEEQVRLLLDGVREEHERRLVTLGIAS